MRLILAGILLTSLACAARTPTHPSPPDTGNTSPTTIPTAPAPPQEPCCPAPPAPAPAPPTNRILNLRVQSQGNVVGGYKHVSFLLQYEPNTQLSFVIWNYGDGDVEFGMAQLSHAFRAGSSYAVRVEAHFSDGGIFNITYLLNLEQVA